MASAPQNSSAEEALDRPPPRLNAKGRRRLQFFTANREKSPARQRALLRFFLFGRRYVESAFDSEDFGPAKLAVEDENFVFLEKFGRILAESFESIAALLHLARDVTTLEIRWYPWKLTARFMTAWMRVASAFRSYRSLSSIRLRTEGYRDRTTHFLLDSLPDCVTHFESGGGDTLNATLLRKRECPLESFQVDFEGLRSPYLADLFRLKTQRISFLREAEENLSQLRVLHTGAPFARNEHLQTLRIRMIGMEERGLLQTFQHLRALNDHLLLFCLVDCVDVTEVEDWKRPHAPDPLDRMKTKAKQIVGLMRAAGFGLEYEEKGDEWGNDAELRVLVHNWELRRRRCRSEVLKRLHWGRPAEEFWPEMRENVLTCSTVYCGVRIVVGLDENYIA
ncbi:hypothetical protein M3Y99_01675900 [Aphelenchoides fujianensis]|nr:hypothetical protein M3Y99_01675900 [Aphelenchoides fujianensis]